VKTTTGYTGTVTLTCALTSSPTGATNLPTCSAGSSTVTLAAYNNGNGHSHCEFDHNQQ